MKAKTNKREPVEPAAIKAWTEGRTIFIELTDSRIIGFPADRFKLLSKATDDQLKETKIRLNGFALRWEILDEDITVPGIVATSPYKRKSFMPGVQPAGHKIFSSCFLFTT